MGAQDDKGRSRQSRIDRLRRRLDEMRSVREHAALVAVIKGVLDLLEDEL